MNIESLQELTKQLKDDYIREAKGERQTKRWLQDFNKEIQEIEQYRGREILELLQNADDARSTKVVIMLDTVVRRLIIANSGPETLPFSDGGVESIMFANLSPKNAPGLIGAKGLGFRAILNWANNVTVRSGNATIEFRRDLVAAFWNKRMAKYISNPEHMEKARIKGRPAPLAILALPNIMERSTPNSTTEIELEYLSDHERNIIEDLRQFKPESLLFLHHLKEIEIKINDETIANYQCEKTAEQGDTATYLLNASPWVVCRKSDDIEIEGRDKKTYDIACAFRTDGRGAAAYPIYCFFPTDIDFSLPCILHATLELNSSRTSLIADSGTNRIMMKLLVKVVAGVADYLKNTEITWNPYRLMRPEKPFIVNSYKSQLFDLLNKVNGNYVPTLGSGYVAPHDSYYMSDGIFDLVCHSQNGIEIFSAMRLKGPYLNSDNIPQNLSQKLESFAAAIADNAVLAKFIVTVCIYANNSGLTLNCHVFRDQDGNTIRGTAFINVGQEVKNIPSFLHFDYVSKDLAASLEEEMVANGIKISSDSPYKQRDMAAYLSKIGPISASEIAAVTQRLLPGRKTRLRPAAEYQELMVCLFNLYLTRPEKFTVGDATPYLPTEAPGGEWKRADSLVFADERFPDGVRMLGLQSFEYPLDKCIAYPVFLDPDGENANAIQEFLVKLGVSKYFVTEQVFFCDDNDYLDELNLNPDVKMNCTWKDKEKEKRNITRVIPSEIISKIELNDLLLLIEKSGYSDDVCSQQEINWFNKSYKTPIKVKLSYAAHLLRKHSAAAVLRYYAVDDNEWLPLMKPKRFDSIKKELCSERLLYALGAVKNFSGFSSAALYDAVNKKADEWERTGNSGGIKSFYHKIKQALHNLQSQGPTMPIRLLCRYRGELALRPSAEVYYSDNIGVSSLVDNLPVLEMNYREGASQIETVFGCRQISSIRTHLRKASGQPGLTARLKDWLDERKPYLCGVAVKNIGSKGGDSEALLQNYANALFRLNIKVVSDASYWVDIEDIDSEIVMRNGDLMYFDDTPTLCTDAITIQDAIDDPLFCNAVVEAICISLKLNSADNVDKFYRLLKSSQKELEYIRNNEIEEGQWQNCCELFNIVQKDEVEFWKKVFDVNGKTALFDPDKVKDSTYIAVTLAIDPALASSVRLRNYHKQQLQAARTRYGNQYLVILYTRLLNTNENSHRRFWPRYKHFCSDGWLEGILDRILYNVIPDYDEEVCREIETRFDFRPSVNDSETLVLPKRHYEYLGDHDTDELTDEDISLLYFDGYSDYFKSFLNGIELSYTTTEDKEETVPQIMMVTTSKQQVRDSGGEKNKPYEKTNRHRKISERRKKQLGDEAEYKVLKALRAPDSGFEVGSIYSERLAAKENKVGDDSKGYDLEYRQKGETLYRCLEIKYCSGNSVIITQNEYEKSQKELKGRYDIALVEGDTIRICQNALDDISRYSIVPDTYRISFDIKEECS